MNPLFRGAEWKVSYRTLDGGVSKAYTSGMHTDGLMYGTNKHSDAPVILSPVSPYDSSDNQPYKQVDTPLWREAQDEYLRQLAREIGLHGDRLEEWVKQEGAN